MWTFFTNDTCRPSRNPNTPCTLGNYPVYVIMAKTQQDIKAGVDFARENNIRLVVRNTGHDFEGRSVVCGSLVINTHSFQNFSFHDKWTGPGTWKGGAATLGCGVQARYFLSEAHKLNPPKIIHTGECPTVGVSGGLVQGDGHGPSTGHFGFIDIWYQGLEAFLKHANRFADLGLFVYYEVQAVGNLHIRPGVGFNETAKSMSKIAKPLLDDFDKIGLNYTTSVAEFDTFFDLYLTMFEDEIAGRAPLSGGIGMTRDDMADKTDEILGAYKTALENNVFLVGHLFNAGQGHGATDSAKHPVWNNVTNFVITSMTLATDLTLSEKQQAQHTLTNVVDESFRKASPHAISYVNEVDPFQPNWQTAFWGPNYGKLVTVREKWDPNRIFYSIATPGTEDWEQIEGFTRLCKKL
ncbi:hypothetical protein ACHAPV_001746 [Trichoderma viride]